MFENSAPAGIAEILRGRVLNISCTGIEKPAIKMAGKLIDASIEINLDYDAQFGPLSIHRRPTTVLLTWVGSIGPPRYKWSHAFIQYQGNEVVLVSSHRSTTRRASSAIVSSPPERRRPATARRLRDPSNCRCPTKLGIRDCGLSVVLARRLRACCSSRPEVLRFKGVPSLSHGAPLFLRKNRGACVIRFSS